jgi:hypothetical protein
MERQNFNNLNSISQELLSELSLIHQDLLLALSPLGSCVVISIGRSTKIFEEFDWAPHTFISIPLTNFRYFNTKEGGQKLRFPQDINVTLKKHLLQHGLTEEHLNQKVVILDFTISGNTLLSFLKCFSEIYSDLRFSPLGMALYHDPDRDEVLKKRFPELELAFINIANKGQYLKILRLKAFKDLYPEFTYTLPQS